MKYFIIAILLFLSIPVFSNTIPGNPKVSFSDAVAMPGQTCVQAIIKTFDESGNPLGGISWRANWKVNGEDNSPTFFGRTNERGISQVSVKSLNTPGGVLILEVDLQPEGYSNKKGSGSVTSANGEFVYWQEEIGSGIAKGVPSYNKDRNKKLSLKSNASINNYFSSLEPIEARKVASGEFNSASLNGNSYIEATGDCDVDFGGTVTFFGEATKTIFIKWISSDGGKTPPVSRIFVDYSNSVNGLVGASASTAIPIYSGHGTGTATVSVNLPSVSPSSKSNAFVTISAPNSNYGNLSINGQDYSEPERVVYCQPGNMISQSLNVSINGISSVTVNAPLCSDYPFVKPMAGPPSAGAMAIASGSVTPNAKPYYMGGCGNQSPNPIRYFNPNTQ